MPKQKLLQTSSGVRHCIEGGIGTPSDTEKRLVI